MNKNHFISLSPSLFLMSNVKDPGFCISTHLLLFLFFQRCFHNNHGTTNVPPGNQCHGQAVRQIDYCYEAPTLVYNGGSYCDGECPMCVGDCNIDADCAGNLKYVFSMILIVTLSVFF